MDNDNAPSETPTSVPAPAGDAYVPAGFWIRAGGYMIDGLIIVVIGVVPSLLLPEGLRALTQFLIAGLYFTIVPVAYKGQTLGKMAAGVRIVRENDSPLTYGRACARWLSYLLSNITLCLGFVCAAFTPRRRALHDYIAGTRVVRVQELGFGRKLAVILVGLLFPTLIVLGVAAALAASRLPPAQGAADEDATKARLAALRSATAIYYADSGGKYPADLNALVPKYVPEITPALDPAAPGVETYGPEVCSGSKEPGQELVAAKLRGTGKWGYVAAPKAPCDGDVFIDSAQADSKGAPWSAY